MGILIPNKTSGILEKLNGVKEIDINLSSACFDESLKNRIIDWISDNSYNLEFIIIHLGIIEKLCGNTDSREIENYFYSTIVPACKSSKIILISGRGKPHNIPAEIRFLNYSQVSSYVSDNCSKLLLYDLCNSARRLK